MTVEGESKLVRQLIMEETRLRLTQLAHWTIDEWRLLRPLTAGASRAGTKLSSHSGVCPIVPAVRVLEIVQATLDVHPGHELHDMLAMTWTHLAIFGTALDAILLPIVPGPIARAARRLLSCCRCSKRMT